MKIKTIKKAIAAITTACFLSMSGCAANNQVDPNYAAYVNAVQEIGKQEQKPLLDLQLNENGTIKSIQVTIPKQGLSGGGHGNGIETYKYHAHPAWDIAKTALSVTAPIFGAVLGAWASGNAFARVLEAGNNGGNTSIVDSYNSSTRTDTKTISGSFNPDNSSRYAADTKNLTVNKTDSSINDSYQTESVATSTDNSVNDSYNPFEFSPVNDFRYDYDITTGTGLQQ